MNGTAVTTSQLSTIDAEIGVFVSKERMMDYQHEPDYEPQLRKAHCYVCDGECLFEQWISCNEYGELDAGFTCTVCGSEIETQPGEPF
jgi:hypothetical protein